MSRNRFLATALAHAARGWHVFPLRPNDKRPAFPNHRAEDCNRSDPRCRTAGAHVGWEPRSTTDPDRIVRAWSAVPYGVGIACGPSRLVVVDLDLPKPGDDKPAEWQIDGVHDGGDVFAVVCDRAGQPFPDLTYTVHTGRGGTHLYFRHPDKGPALRNTAGTLGWLVDTRAHGGYVVAAGSIANGRPYVVAHDTDPAPLPDWLTQALAPAPLPAQRPTTVDISGGRAGRYVAAAVDSSVRAVRTASGGQRNRELYRAAVALGQLVAGGALDEAEAFAALYEAGTQVGQSAGEAARTIRSGFRAGAGRPRTVAA